MGPVPPQMVFPIPECCSSYLRELSDGVELQNIQQALALEIVEHNFMVNLRYLAKKKTSW